MGYKNKYIFIGLMLFIHAVANKLNAQCSAPLNSFPYNENFEATNGNWTIQGSAPSWEWGSPAKPVINTAGGGNKCWVTGGLTNGFYNSGEASWLQSPCFDFSALQFPYINFKVWWETETGFDGANLQYSTDNGSSWTTLGSSSEPANCLNANWYNSFGIRFLSSFGSFSTGWAGSVQQGSGNCSSGGGSGNWVVAKHTLDALAGQPNVIFRFIFGAGTQCNNYDGFAIDDILITEAPANNGTIDYNCVDSNTVSFQFDTPLCPTDFSWNFGDPNSGDNASSVAEPNHVFSAPGIYNIIVSVRGPGNAPFDTSTTVTILGLTTQVVKPITCGIANTGSVAVKVSGGTGPYTYLWNSIPEQFNDTAVNLTGGSYNVLVSQTNACPISTVVNLVAPNFSIKDSLQQPGCLFTEGKIVLQIIEGQAPFSYSWLPVVSVDSIAATLQPGNYSVTIKDSRNCLETRNYTIATLPTPSLVVTNKIDANCNGRDLGSAIAVASNGTAPYKYLWSALPVQNSDTVINLKNGQYFVTVTDAKGCIAADSVSIAIGGFCDDIYFPNAFSPDRNGTNDFFGALGNVIEMSNYFMAIYNRFGQVVFKSNNPLLKWDGIFQGTNQSIGTYVWHASYLYKNLYQRNLKGTINIIR